MTDNKLLKNRRLHIIFSITLIAVMGVASLTPAFPKIAEDLHLTKGQVAMLISFFTVPGIFLTPFTGILADRFGRKTILVPSLFIFALAGFACFFSTNFHALLILRLIQGIGAASLGSLNVTLIGDFFKGKDRPTAMGYNATVLSLSTASYPLIGGLLAGIAWYYPFLLPLLAIPVGLFVVLGLREPVFAKTPSFFTYLKKVTVSIARKEVIGIFLLSILTFFILYGAILTYIPFLLKERFDLSPEQIGIFLSLSSLSTAAVATQTGNLTQKFGSKNLLVAAFILYTITCISIPFVTNLFVFIIPVMIFGTAQALNIPSLQTLLANLAPDEQRGFFMSFNGMVLRVGQTFGPPVIGIGYALNKYTGVYFLAASIALTGLILIYLLVRKKKK